MDYFELRDNLDEEPIEQTELSPIQRVYEGATIFITGACGFMGRVAIEKLLRTCNVALIYILVRDKKGVSGEARVAEIFNDVFFEPLKLKKPEELRKVKIISGDCSLPDLGLSDVDKAKMSNVNIIIHSAAALNFTQHLKVAFNTNVVATKYLLELAQHLPQLQAFVYISTAFSHAYNDLVEEKFYDMIIDDDDLAQICNELDDKQIGALTPKLLGKWDNVYLLTKACAENVVKKYTETLPIAIIRPSLVLPTMAEPLQYWINNFNGLVGVVFGTGMGILKVWCINEDTISDMIPVDVNINMMLAAIWEVITKNATVKIYNCVSSTVNPFIWKDLLSTCLDVKASKSVDSTRGLSDPQMNVTRNTFIFWLYTLYYHMIPAFFVDSFLRFIGKSPILMKMYIKIYTLNKLAAPYFLKRQVLFSSENMKEMWNNLHPIDKKLFYFDFWTLNWKRYWRECPKGLRVYLLKDPMETLPEGQRHLTWLKIRSFITSTVIWLTTTAVAYFLMKNCFTSLFIH